MRGRQPPGDYMGPDGYAESGKVVDRPCGGTQLAVSATTAGPCMHQRAMALGRGDDAGLCSTLLSTVCSCYVLRHRGRNRAHAVHRQAGTRDGWAWDAVEGRGGSRKRIPRALTWHEQLGARSLKLKCDELTRGGCAYPDDDLD